MSHVIPVEDFEAGQRLPSKSLLSGESDTKLFRVRAVAPLRWSAPALLMLGPIAPLMAVMTGPTVDGWLPMTRREGLRVSRLRRLRVATVAIYLLLFVSAQVLVSTGRLPTRLVAPAETVLLLGFVAMWVLLIWIDRLIPSVVVRGEWVEVMTRKQR